MASGKESVAKRECCKMSGYGWRRGDPCLAPVHKKLAPVNDKCMRHTMTGYFWQQMVMKLLVPTVDDILCLRGHLALT